MQQHELTPEASSLLSRLASHPPAATLTEAAAAAGNEQFVVALASLVQTLVVEVEASRSDLLDAQSALASVLKRMQNQHVNFTTATNSANIMERAVNELSEANARLRCQLYSRRRPKSGKRLSAAERAAIDVPAADWSLRVQPDAELCLMAEPTATREHALASLVVAGSAAGRCSGAPATVIKQISDDERARRRQQQWESGASGATIVPAVPTRPTSASMDPAPLRPPRGSPVPFGSENGDESGTGGAASAASAVVCGACVGGGTPVASVGLRQAASDAAARAGRADRPWSQRASELHAMRPEGSEAAHAASAASAAAIAVSAMQHRAFVTATSDESSSLALTGHAASPSHAPCPAWRTSLKPRPFARSFSGGPMRPASSSPGSFGLLRAGWAPIGTAGARGCGDVGSSSAPPGATPPRITPQLLTPPATASPQALPRRAGAKRRPTSGARSGSIVHVAHPVGVVHQHQCIPRPASAGLIR